MKTPLSILSSTLNAAAIDAAISKQQSELTLLAVKGFSQSRTGNAAVEAREMALQYVAALDVVIRACAVEASENVVPMRSTIRAVPVVGVAR